MPVSIIKNFTSCYYNSYERLNDILNDCLKENKFLTLMKIAEFIPVFKKLDINSKDNYPPTCFLPNFAKLLESILFS